MTIQASIPPPYYAVIFSSSLKTDANLESYLRMAEKMERLALSQDGYLGIESVRDENGKGITISYWRDLTTIRDWKSNLEHQLAQRRGQSDWYQNYSIQISYIEKRYSWSNED